MIYRNQQRAEQVARELNERFGHPRSRAILTNDGWTVIASYEFGLSGANGWTVDADRGGAL